MPLTGGHENSYVSYHRNLDDRLPLIARKKIIVHACIFEFRFDHRVIDNVNSSSATGERNTDRW